MEFLRGTVSAEDFFQTSSSYKVAEGTQKEQLTVARCKECGHGFTPLSVSAGAILEWYARAEQDEPFLATSRGRRTTARRVLSRIEALTSPPGRLVDVGSGPGFFLDEARRRGWQVQGVEVAGWAVRYAQERFGLPVTQGDFNRLRGLPPASVDVVTAFDVIEHLVSPRAFVQASERVLASGGWLVLTTPWFGSPLSRIMGKRWYCIFPAHLHYFTRASLTRLLADAGFRIVRARRHTRYLGARYVWSRVRRQLGGKEQSLPRRAQKVVIPINLGDEFEVYARKV